MKKIKSFEDLKERKMQLQQEIREIESIISFENPRKTLGVMTEGFTEKYLGGVMDSDMGKNAFFLAEKYLLPTLELGSAKLIGNIITKKMKPNLGKTLLGIGAAVLLPIIFRKVKKEIDIYQQRETAKSMTKLI